MSNKKSTHYFNSDQHFIQSTENQAFNYVYPDTPNTQIYGNPSYYTCKSNYQNQNNYEDLNNNNSYYHILNEDRPISSDTLLSRKQDLNNHLQEEVIDQNCPYPQKKDIINQLNEWNIRQSGFANKPKILYVQSQIISNPTSPQVKTQNHSSKEQTQGQNLCSIQLSLNKSQRKNYIKKDDKKYNHYAQSNENDKNKTYIKKIQEQNHKQQEKGDSLNGGSLDLNKQTEQFQMMGRFCSAGNSIKKKAVVQPPELKKNISDTEIKGLKKTESLQYEGTPDNNTSRITKNNFIQVKFAQSASQQTIKQQQLNNTINHQTQPQPGPFQKKPVAKDKSLQISSSLNSQYDETNINTYRTNINQIDTNNMDEFKKKHTYDWVNEHMDMNMSLRSSHNSFFNIPSFNHVASLIHTASMDPYANNVQIQKNKSLQNNRSITNGVDLKSDNLIDNKQENLIKQNQNVDNKLVSPEYYHPLQLFSFKGNNLDQSSSPVNNAQSLQHIEDDTKSYSLITYSMGGSLRNKKNPTSLHQNIATHKLKKTTTINEPNFPNQQIQNFDECPIENWPIIKSNQTDPVQANIDVKNQPRQHSNDQEVISSYVGPMPIVTTNPTQQLYFSQIIQDKSQINSQNTIRDKQQNRDSIQGDIGKFNIDNKYDRPTQPFLSQSFNRLSKKQFDQIRSIQKQQFNYPHQQKPIINEYEHFSSYQINPTNTICSVPVYNPPVARNNFPPTIFPNQINYQNQRSILQTPIKTQQSYSIQYPSNKIGQFNSIQIPYSEDRHFPLPEYSPYKNTIQQSFFQSNNSSKILQIKQLLQPSQTHHKKQQVISDKNWYSQPKPSIHSLSNTPNPKTTKNLSIKMNIEQRVSHGSNKKLKVTCIQNIAKKSNRHRQNTSQKNSRKINFGGLLNKLDEYRKVNGIRLSQNLLDSDHKIYYKSHYSYKQQSNQAIQSNKPSIDSYKQEKQSKIGRYVRLPSKQPNANTQSKCTKKCFNMLCKCLQTPDQPVINSNKTRKINLIAYSPQREKSRNIGNVRQTNRVSLHIDPQIIQLSNPYNNQPIRLLTNPNGMQYGYQSEGIKDSVDAGMHSTGLMTNNSYLNKIGDNNDNNLDSGYKSLHMRSYLLN